MKTSRRAYKLIRARVLAGVLAACVLGFAELALVCHLNVRCQRAAIYEVQDTAVPANWINLW